MMFKKKPKNGGRCLRVMAILVVSFMIVASSVYAESLNRFSNNQNLKSYICTNSATIAYGITNISTSTIIPNYCRVLGFSIMPLDTSKHSEFVVSLIDAANYTASTYLFDEAERANTADKLPTWYAYPRMITTQLSVWQGPNTVVVVYYEDKREI